MEEQKQNILASEDGTSITNNSETDLLKKRKNLFVKIEILNICSLLCRFLFLFLLVFLPFLSIETKISGKTFSKDFSLFSGWRNLVNVGENLSNNKTANYYCLDLLSNFMSFGIGIIIILSVVFLIIMLVAYIKTKLKGIYSFTRKKTNTTYIFNPTENVITKQIGTIGKNNKWDTLPLVFNISTGVSLFFIAYIFFAKEIVNYLLKNSGIFTYFGAMNGTNISLLVPILFLVGDVIFEISTKNNKEKLVDELLLEDL